MTNTEQEAVNAQPDISSRTARCTCQQKRPSSSFLPFFEYRGPGSQFARTTCRHCHYADVAHTPEVMARNAALKCRNFEALSDGHEFDSFYCGHGGWD